MIKDEKISDKERLHKAVELADKCCIVISDKCIAVEASNREIMSLISMLVSEVKEKTDLTEELIMDAVDLGFKSDEERIQMAVDILKRRLTGEED